MTANEEKAKILICEDEALIAANLESHLNGLGYIICGVATSAEKALEHVEQHQPDLIMMDIVLKGEMDGICAAEIIRDKWGIPVVFLTSYADTDRLERAKLTYPFGYILKPFQDRELRITVEMALYVSKIDAERRKAEERSKIYFEKSRDSIFIVSPDSKLVEVNEAASELTGYGKEELLNMTIPDLLEDADLDAYKTYFHQIMAGKSVVTKTWLLRKDGTKVYTEFNNTCIHFSGYPYMHTSARDITDRRKSEEALRESEEKYRTTLRSTPDTVAISRVEDGAFLELNDGFTRMFGYSREEALGRTVPDLGLYFSPTDRNHLIEALTTKEEVNELEFTYRRKDGSLFEGLQSARPIRYGDEDCLISVVKDISSFKKAQQALKESEKTLQLFMDAIPQAAYLIDDDCIVLAANTAMKQQHIRDEDEIVGKCISDFLPPDVAQTRCEYVAQAVRTGKLVHFEDVRDGLYLENYIQPLRDESDKVTRLAILSVDITDRKRTEEALRESEERFRDMVEGSIQGVLVHRDNKALFVNQACSDIFGYTRNEILEMETVLTLFHPDEQDRLAGYRDARLRGEDAPIHYEYKGIQKDGSEIWLDNMVRVVNWSGEKAIQTIIIDITERKRAEEAVKESEERLRTLVEYSPEAIVVFDADTGKFVDANKNSEYLYGLEAEELFKLGPVEVSPPEQPDGRMSFEAAMAYIQEALEGSVPVFEWTHLNVAENKEVPCEIRLVRLPASGRNLIRASMTDIRARKRAEEERVKLESQLQQARKMEAIGTLAGGIAHDFNNLLQAITGYTQILLMNKKENNPDYSKLTGIQNASERAAQLVQQLLLFSRKVETERRPLDLNQEVEHARRILERTIPKMVAIELHLGSRLLTVNADHVQVEQVLLNLGSNAADAMPDGGKLIIETENVTLEKEYVHNHIGSTVGNYVLLTVSDTGKGMDRETVEHIFDPFYTTKDIGKGTGLGLASVYGIVKSHGGYINCISQVGQGTTFHVYLPAYEQAVAVEAEEVVVQLPKGGVETILLVDDEEQIRDVGSEMIQKFGYTVLTAASGEQALEIYKDSPNEIDLVILDIGMPGMGGYKCLREVLKLDPSAKVLIASGYSLEGQLKEALEAGAAGYVGKPYQMADLLNKVRTVLDEQD